MSKSIEVARHVWDQVFQRNPKSHHWFSYLLSSQLSLRRCFMNELSGDIISKHITYLQRDYMYEAKKCVLKVKKSNRLAVSQ